MAIERPPKISQEELMKAMMLTPDEPIAALVEHIDETFEYWDTTNLSSG